MADLTVRFSQSALDEFELLLTYFAEHNGSITVLRQYVENIITECQKLAYFPHRGVAHEEIAPNLYLLPLQRQTVIAYTIDGNTVTVTNVFHGGRDYEMLLGRD